MSVERSKDMPGSFHAVAGSATPRTTLPPHTGWRCHKNALVVRIAALPVVHRRQAGLPSCLRGSIPLSTRAHRLWPRPPAVGGAMRASTWAVNVGRPRAAFPPPGERTRELNEELRWRPRARTGPSQPAGGLPV